MTDCSYEYFTIHTDSVSDTTWIDGNQSQFTSHLMRPIKEIVEVSIVNCSFDVSGSNVVYIKNDEFESHFNMNTLNPNLESEPSSKSKTNGSLARILVGESGRTVFNQYDFDTTSRYIHPIRKLDRITTRLYDENGTLVNVNSNTFVTYKLKCKLENMCI